MRHALQQFQLGEGSNGARLLRNAHALDEPELPAAMELFVQEEQRHSAVLGLYMDRQGIPRLREHWLDGCFRWVRSLAGPELMLTVLTTAELMAMPFYRALHDATRCGLLRRICQRILLDEVQHLEFQAINLALCARHRGDAGRALTLALQWAALTAASVLVYVMYRRLLRAANVSLLRFWHIAFEAHTPIRRELLSDVPMAQRLRNVIVGSI